MRRRFHSRYASAAILFAAVALCTVPLPCVAQAEIEVEAFVGQPFGVGRMLAVIDPRGDDGSTPMLTERTGRALYPTYTTRKVRGLLRELVGAPRKVEAFFLFTGDAPLEMTLSAPTPTTFRVKPRKDPAGATALLGEWWREYSSVDKRKNQPADYPTLVEDYLSATLARRMQLPVPEGFLSKPSDGDLTHAIRVLGGAETVRSEWIRKIALGRAESGGVADQPLPKPLNWPVPESPVPEGVKVEPIAERVPPELFYCRFGSFTNYLWLSHRLEDWGGEFSNLVSERSIDYGNSDRLQEQLCLHESELADLLGPTVISDVAIVGADLFLREGAAMGVLFEARNNLLLSKDFADQRVESMQANADAVEEQVQMGDMKVSFIHTPDNRLRSYYVAIDGYHFVTTSRVLAERFVQVKKDGKSLGKTAEFRYARDMFPIDRNDTAFVYLSAAFLQNLVNPRYQVELQRRLRSLAEMDVLGVAQIEGKAERDAGQSIPALVDAGVLPRGFGERADGSELIDQNGRLVDTLRGPRGMFVPVPDVPIKGVTAAEATACMQVATSYAASWDQMTPLVVAVNRTNGPQKDMERVTLDVRATALAAKQHKLLASQLGSPSNQRLAPVAGDVVALDAVLGGTIGGGSGDYHLFGGLRNGDPRLASGGIMDKLLGVLGGKEIEGYLGGWPRPGLLWFLGASNNLPVDQNGYSQFITGSWRRVFGQYTLLSFQPEVLAEISPQLKFVPAERPGQLWLHADDLRESKLAPLINSYGYRRALGLSRGNAQFLDSLTEQLHVPPAAAQTTSESLLGAKLVCPLGGKYELAEAANGPTRWRSTAWVNAPRGRFAEAPTDYQFPAMYWLRGVDIEGRLTEDVLAVHADLTMPVKTRPSFSLPSFSLPFGKPQAEAVPAKPTPVAKPKVEPKVEPKAEAKRGPREF